MKDEWLELCAPEGTKTRDLFNLEFEKIDMTSSLRDDVMMEAESLYSEYCLQARIIIRNSPDLMKVLRQNVEDWVSGSSPDQSIATDLSEDLDDLKVAA